MTAKLEVLLADGVIDEVLGRLKSGKEADISLVRRGDVVVAAKVYKDRATRSFKNNSDYKEGRKVRNTRTQRAMDSGGRFGREAEEQAWKSAEADALYKLAGSGVRVPEPLMFYEGVLLMDVVRDAEGRPAPRLIDVAIERDAAMGIYADLLAQMISMLCCDLIHGDLSPYNILAAADGPTIIDFPQVISAAHSSRAEFFFLRDFDNVVQFLASFDPGLSVHAGDGRSIWRAYVSRDLTPQFVPPPPPPPRAARPRPDQQQGRRDGRPPQRFGGRGPQQGPGGNRGQQQGPGGNRGPQQGPGGNRGPQQGPGGNRGPQQAPGGNRGPQQGAGNRGWQPPGDARDRPPPQQQGPGDRRPSSGDRSPQQPGDRSWRSPQDNRNRSPQQASNNRAPRGGSGYGSQQRSGERAPQGGGGRPASSFNGRPAAQPQPGGGHRRRPKRRF